MTELDKWYEELLALEDKTAVKPWLGKQKPDPPADAIETLKGLAERQSSDGKLQHACQTLDYAFELAQFLEQPLETARIWQGRANVLQEHDLLEESWQATETAVSIYQAAGEPFEALKAQAVAIYVLGALERFDEAVALYEEIQPVFAGRGFTKGLFAITYNIANVFSHSWQLHQALAAFQEARTLLNELGWALWEARLLYDMGVVYQRLDDLSEAKAHYLQAYPLLKENKDAVLISKTQASLAQLCFREGQYADALGHIQQAKDDLELLSDEAAHAGYIGLFEAQIRRRLDDTQHNETLLTDALARFEQAGYHIECAEVVTELAHAAAARGTSPALAQALSYLEQAQAYIAHLDLALYEACLLLEQGELLLQLARTSEALARVKKAQPIFARAGLTVRIWQTAVLQADVLASREPTNAQTLYKKLLDEMAEQPLPLLIARCWHGLGRVLLRMQPTEAARCLEEAIQHYNQVRHTLRSHRHQAGFSEMQGALFDELLAALHRLPQHESTILLWTERFKAHVLAEMLLKQPPDAHIETRFAALLQEREQLRSQIDFRLASFRESGQMVAAGQRGPAARRHDRFQQQQVSHLQRQLQQVEEAIQRQQQPTQAWREGAVPDKASFHHLLDHETMLVTYYTVHDQLYALTATHDPADIALHPLGIQLAELAQQWQQASRWVLQPRPQLARAKRRLGQLWDVLVAPFHARLQGYSRLLIVPHRLLYQIPFAALYDRQQGAYLVERWQVQLAPSMTILAHCRQKQPGKTAVPLIVGHPGTPYLTHVQPEVEAIQQLFPDATLLFEDAATIKSVIANLNGRSIIHLSGHIEYDYENPLQSGMPLANGRLLRAADLYLRYGLIEGALVVAAGCDSGRVQPKGNDLLGLTSGFFYAGASAILMSLWSIDDAATSHFAPLFYQQLQAGLSTSQALQASQQEMLASSNFQHPIYWAPFSLIGATTKIGYDRK